METQSIQNGEPSGPRRHARRTAKAVEEAIHRSVLDVLLTDGYAAVTFEGIAKRAQTSKPVLYRRYPTRSAMALAAVSTVPVSFPTPDTGSLRTDLLELLREALRWAARIGSDNLRALVGECTAEQLRQIDPLMDRLTQMHTKVFERARARGELGPQPLPASICALPNDLLRHAVLLGDAASVDPIPLVDEICVPLFQHHSRY